MASDFHFHQMKNQKSSLIIIYRDDPDLNSVHENALSNLEQPLPQGPISTERIVQLT